MVAFALTLIVTGPVIDFHMHHVIAKGILAKTVPVVKQKSDDKSNYFKFKAGKEKDSGKNYFASIYHISQLSVTIFSSSIKSIHSPVSSFVAQLSESLTIGLRAPPPII